MQVTKTYSKLQHLQVARQIQLLYWLVNNEQTRITLSRNTIDEPFAATIPLPLNAKSGQYAIRSIRAVDDSGTSVAISQDQMLLSHLNTVVDLTNTNSDEQFHEMISNLRPLQLKAHK